MKEFKKLITKNLGFLPCKCTGEEKNYSSPCPYKRNYCEQKDVICLYNCVSKIIKIVKDNNISRGIFDFFSEDIEMFKSDFIISFNGNITLSPYIKKDSLDSKNSRQQSFLIEVRKIVEEIIALKVK